MVDPEMHWPLDEPPATDDPDDLRAYIRDLRTIQPQTPVILTMIEGAERMLSDLERDRAQNAA